MTPRQYQAPAQKTVEIVELSNSYIIDVQNPEGFVPRAQDPFLHIGDVIIPASGNSRSVGPYGLRYKLTPEQFEQLEDGAEIRLGAYKVPLDSYGPLDKSNVIGGQK